VARTPRPDPAAEIRNDIESDALKPIYLLFGKESHLATQAFDVLWKAALGTGPRGFNDQVFLGEKASGAAIVSAAAHLPMMAPRRVIAVRNVAKLKKEDSERLAEYCATPSPTTVLILLGVPGAPKSIDGRTKLAKAIRAQGRWCEFKKLYGRNLRSWIEGEAQRLGNRLDPSGPGYLEALLGNDLSQIANGLRNASLYVGERTEIGMDDLELVISGSREEARWDLLDDLGRRRLRPALRNLQILFRQGEDPHGLLALIRRRVRMLLEIERAIAKGARRDEALKGAGVAPNMTWKWEDQVGNYSPRELQRAASRLVTAESDVKGGRRIPPRWSVECALLDILR
jgi:DNA polymerase-3 subunit delta